MSDRVLDASRRLAKIGGSMLICVGFVLLVVGVSEAGVPVRNWMLLIGLVLLAIVLRLNLARVDRKYEREAVRRRQRED